MEDVRRLKDGTIMRFHRGFLSNKWKPSHAVLLSSSLLQLFDDKKPKVSVLLKDVVPYICIGMQCDRMPVRRPQLPEGRSVHNLVGIGMDPEADTVHWILFGDDDDMKSWFEEIMSTLPKPANPPPTQNGGPGGAPPPYPGGPGGAPGQQGPNVVVVDRGQDDGGMGMGTGLLLGALAGYGMGSFFGGGLMGGMGGMGGFGSYYSDNDTTTVNNYYDGAPPAEDNGDMDGGGDYDGGDYGGGDFGDFGGGDF